MIEMIKFLIVTLLGFFVDMLIAWFIATRLDLPLWVASVIGFSFAALINYLLHEFWTFKAATTQITPQRAAQYVIGLIIAAAIRATTVAALTGLFSEAKIVVVLTGGACLSFCFNYMISKHFVFNRSRT